MKRKIESEPVKVRNFRADGTEFDPGDPNDPNRIIIGETPGTEFAAWLMCRMCGIPVDFPRSGYEGQVPKEFRKELQK